MEIHQSLKDMTKAMQTLDKNAGLKSTSKEFNLKNLEKG